MKKLCGWCIHAFCASASNGANSCLTKCWCCLGLSVTPCLPIPWQASRRCDTQRQMSFLGLRLTHKCLVLMWFQFLLHLNRSEFAATRACLHTCRTLSIKPVQAHAFVDNACFPCLSRITCLPCPLQLWTLQLSLSAALSLLASSKMSWMRWKRMAWAHLDPTRSASHMLRANRMRHPWEIW